MVWRVEDGTWKRSASQEKLSIGVLSLAGYGLIQLVRVINARNGNEVVSIRISRE